MFAEDSGYLTIMDLLYSNRRLDTSKLHVTGFLLCLVAFFMPIVTATYSIVATDAKTRQVGGAGATCLEDRDIFEALYRSAPNRSVLHTQGLLLDRDDPIVMIALDMMQKDESLDDILNAMQGLDTANYTFTTSLDDFEIPNVDVRQYGIADFYSQAGYTGTSLASVWYGIFGINGTEQVDVGKKFENDRYIYHTMGNVVTKGTVGALQRGFENQNDDFNFGLCDMAGKLMTAMNGVAAGGFGDARCLNDGGKSATGAYLHIDNADGTALIHINKIGDGTSEPVEEMKETFHQWRKDNPCPGDSSGASMRLEFEFTTLLSMFGILCLIVS
jgi:hypothetical protein